MFMDTPETLMYAAVGAFVLGWLVAKTGSYFSNRMKARNRDPRDDRIRSLDAELRVAKSDAEKVREELAARDKDLAQARQAIAEREVTAEQQLRETEKLRRDLKESVKKTRELRAELSDRATENLRSEVKLREVETELSVSRASTDMLATGVLDYSISPDDEDGEPRLKISKGRS
jgi:septal ring factor EnvC (AmiA/AmiB activator)